MPRYPNQSPLPPLKKTLPQFRALQKDRPKVEQVATLLNKVIIENRTTHNLTFYSTRDIARFFNTSQNTATLAIQRLEAEGLLRRVRGSHTVMLGNRIIAQSRIRAVAGLMSWDFAQRFSTIHGTLIRHMAEELWPHQIALDIIPHYDLGERRPDLNETLKRHIVDFMIWPFPFDHHLEHLFFLQDRGIRSLVIGVEGVHTPFKPEILVDFRTPYEQLLQYWKEEHGIRRVIVVTPREFTPRRRIKLFSTIAREAGFNCHIESNSYTLPSEILAREEEKIGIVLLDEHTMAEFTFYDPPAFVELVRRHRILFGNGNINVPFVPHGESRVERIYLRLLPSQTDSADALIPVIAETLVRWSFGDFTAKPKVVQAKFWENGELWRYL